MKYKRRVNFSFLPHQIPSNIRPVLGDCFGVNFTHRGSSDPHLLISFMIEDDGLWAEKDFQLSSYWIDDCISTLQKAKLVLENKAQKVERDGWREK